MITTITPKEAKMIAAMMRAEGYANCGRRDVMEVAQTGTHSNAALASRILQALDYCELEA